MSGVTLEKTRRQAFQALQDYNAAIGVTGGGVARGTRGAPAVRAPPLYRSNSSLDLEGGGDGPHLDEEDDFGLRRREFGSQGSLDASNPSLLGHGGGDSFFEMLREFRPADREQRSPGPPRIADYLRGRVEALPTTENASNMLANGGAESLDSPPSPKLRLKLHRFLRDNKEQHLEPTSLFRKFRKAEEDCVDGQASSVMTTSHPPSTVPRRKAFAHHDCQSLTVNLSYAGRLRQLLSKRRNTATGASAAALAHRNRHSPAPSPSPASSAEDLLTATDGVVADSGDGRSNGLVLSCTYFRNEIGGEEERLISLTRATARRAQYHSSSSIPQHRPSSGSGVAVLEFAPGESHWKNPCPFHRPPNALDGFDKGSLYYRLHFAGQDHHNWFGIDENLGPVAISIKRERVPEEERDPKDKEPPPQFQYRTVIRTSELATLRGCILEESVPSIKCPGSSSSQKSLHDKEVIEFLAPEVQLSCLRLGVMSQQTEEQLMKLDEQGVSAQYKVGVLYCKAGQSTEEEMYNNEDGSPAFNEFLQMLGQKVRLKGFDRYKAGLDNKSDSTGTHSVFATLHHCQIMFHVSTMLPFTPNNSQQLLRKRHIGNDIVTIVFQEPGALPFTPRNMRSQFQHVFVVVRALNPCTEATQYSVAVSRSKEVPLFGPPIPEGATFSKTKSFADFLIAKVINAENAAHRSDKFATMATRTKQEYLKDLATNYVTATTIETSPKFPMLSFSNKKSKETKNKSRALVLDKRVRGAVCWAVVVEDCGQSGLIIDSIMAISTDSVVILNEATGDLLFASPTSSVLGWSSSSQSGTMRLYYHVGECVILRMRDGQEEDVGEVCARLRATTFGAETVEYLLRRNCAVQLGFHVQHDGLVTEVERTGLAALAGLQQGSRLVEICKVAVSTLSQEQMVELLKTSSVVTVSVIPPSADGSPRRGCSVPNCCGGGTSPSAGLLDGDYENVGGAMEFRLLGGVGGAATAAALGAAASGAHGRRTHMRTATHQQPVPGGGHPKRYERNLSPPRSSNSSGYGTGSSSKSFGSGTEVGTLQPHDNGWFDLSEPSELAPPHQESPPPPPLPSRGAGSSVMQQQLGASSRRRTNVTEAPSLPFMMPRGRAPLAAPESNPHEPTSRTFSAHARLVNGMDRPEHKYKPTRMVHSSSLDLKSKSSSSSSSIDGHSESTLVAAHSEEDIVGRDSPSQSRLKSGGNSRNQSPRPLKDCIRKPTRNAGSSLQEDLMRLINPDYLLEDPPDESSPKEDPAPEPPPTKSEVIVTKARPATVISNASTASSPAPSESVGTAHRVLSKEERLSPRAIPGVGLGAAVHPPAQATANPLPLPPEMDWPSLVDTATKAMLQVASSTPRQSPTEADEGDRRDLQARLGLVEAQLQREQQQRALLQEEVERLRQENFHLQEESKTATQQLRNFTTWFFHSMDKQ